MSTRSATLMRAVFLILPAIAWPGAVARAGNLLIQGGTVVTVEGSRAADVRIRGEQIAVVGTLQREPGDEQVIDAKGLLLLPGGVDPHVHLAPIEPIYYFADDFESGSRAALAGGITTVGHMAFPKPGELPLATLARERVLIEGQTQVDVFVHTTIIEPTSAVIEQLPELAAAGQPSIKVFMSMETFEPQLANFQRLLRGARQAGIRVAIHCEDVHTLEYTADVLTAEGKISMEHYPDSRPVVSEVVAVQRAIAMAETTGASLYVVHLSSGRALGEIAAQRGRLPIYAETRPIYLHLTGDQYARPDGALFVGMPPIRAAQDRAALWEGLANGSVDTVATDHAPWTREEKLDPSLTIQNPRPGVNNLQVMLPMLFSEGVGQKKIEIERFVAVSSTNAAKLFGLYPKKGTIAPGSDADVVLWDPTEKRTIRDEDALSKTGFSIYSGTEVTGWPRTTLRRGEIVYDGGKVLAQPASGRIVSRVKMAEVTE